jgi:uncharacterized protein (DUF924 family)
MTPAWRDAVTRGDAGAVRALLRDGADVDARDRHGQTGLMLAAHGGHTEVAGVLLEHGAAPNVTAKFGLSALMLAVVAGHADTAQRLARAGADRSLRGTGAPGFAGKTARDLALARELLELAAALVAPEDVLGFWFGAAGTDAAAAAAREDVWFGASREVDARIREDFAVAVADAAAGRLDGWLAQPRAALALVLLLDQFPRHLWRGNAAAFAHDAHARAAMRRALDAGFADALSPIEATFLVLPLQHSESLADQDEGVRWSTRLHAEAPLAWRPYLDTCLRFATQHRDLIVRFGRFPHRNAALGRESTVDEQQYLARGGATFGQTT